MITKVSFISFGLMAAMIQPFFFLLPAVFTTVIFFNTLYLVPICIFLFILMDAFAVAALNNAIDVNHITTQAALVASIFIFYIVRPGFDRHFFYVAFFTLAAVFLLFPLPSNEVFYVRTLQRSFLLPVLILILMDVQTTRKFFELMKRCLFVVIFISIVLIIYQYSAGIHLYYQSFGLNLFYQDRNIPIMGSGLPIGFETKAFFGGTIARPLGVFVSPDKFAYLINILFVTSSAAALLKRRYKVFIFLVLFALFCHYLINVKAAAFQFVLFLTLFTSYFLFPRLSPTYRISTIALLIGLALALILVIVPESWLSGSGAIQHIWSLGYPFSYQSDFILNYLFGYGFGNAYGEFKHAYGAESFVGSLMAGGGLFAVMIIFLIYGAVEKNLRKKFFRSTEQHFCRYIFLSSGLWTGFFSSFFSISALSFFQTMSLGMCVLLYLGWLDCRGTFQRTSLERLKAFRR